jgi:hypothetical protein
MNFRVYVLVQFCVVAIKRFVIQLANKEKQVMQNSYFITVIALTLSLSSCLTPSQASFENARTLGRGNAQLNGNASISHHRFIFSSGSSVARGVGVKYGINDRLDVYARHNHVSINTLFLNNFDFDSQFNYTELGIKHSILNKRFKLAINLPVGRYDLYQNLESQHLHVAFPQLIGSITISKHFEAHTNLNLLMLDLTQPHLAIPGSALGVAASSDINRWGIGAEIGVNALINVTTGLNAYVNF